MEARQLLKSLRDDGWYLGDTAGAARQYVHPDRPETITVCVRYTDELGPETLASAGSPGPALRPSGHDVVLESTTTGYSAWSPDLPGCIATGPTRAEAESRLRDAMALHLSALRRR